ncbi:MAG: hypothetical protein F6K10_40055, partial [Moorea sp. SIO2B7]|nr:hypothetical protein [Moorena sp. SIO2B7]
MYQALLEKAEKQETLGKEDQEKAELKSPLQTLEPELDKKLKQPATKVEKEANESKKNSEKQLNKPSIATSNEPKTKADNLTDKEEEILISSSSEKSDAPADSISEKISSSSDSVEIETKDQETDTTENDVIFQAVGIIKGEVNFSDDGENSITLAGKKYPLFYIPSKRRAWDALKKEIEVTGEKIQKLIVYPKVIHFPKKHQIHCLTFQLVGFDTGKEPSGISQELNELEFKLSGLWQFIPVCRTPCISVMRNFTPSRLEYIKQVEVAKKVKFMKASHLPLLWRDSPVRPFRFNPKAEKEEQGHPAFVQVKTRLLPGRDVFGFIEQLGPIRENAPKFLKASKKDKMEA